MKLTTKSTSEAIKPTLPFKEIGVIVLLITVTSLVYFYWYEPAYDKDSINETTVQFETPFTKEGEVTFISSTDNLPVKTIEVAVADDEFKQEEGLMGKGSLPDNAGMLFLFEQEAQRLFWMKNTRISLDILFVNANYEIITIHKYTQPNSEVSIPSNKPAQYVIETNAGFCETYGIREGDKIKFRLIEIK